MILIKPTKQCPGYLNDPEATSQLFAGNGWIRTGDVGRLDDRGHLFVEGTQSKYLSSQYLISMPDTGNLTGISGK